MTEHLESRIERFIRTGEGEFEALALELFSYQFAKNLPYRAYCRATGRVPGMVSHWEEIPAVPISAFKSSELVTFPIGRAAAVFHSSGTTQKTPSRHFLRTLSYYEASLKAGFEKWVLADSQIESVPFLILAPSPSEAPHSSLTWMLDVVMRKWGASGSGYFLQRGFVDERRLFKQLTERQSAGHPVALLGTTLAFLSFFDLCAKHQQRFVCAPGSRIMDTGGMKTQTREVSRDEFLRSAWEYLGLPEVACTNEYGMCELSSQFYARGASNVFQGPSWVRTLAIDPESGARTAREGSGLLTHFDLANVDSVMAIQTEDLGEMREDGFVLKGRAPAAALKGCSIDMEAYLKRQ
jgi:hypothetical protein